MINLFGNFIYFNSGVTVYFFTPGISNIKYLAPSFIRCTLPTAAMCASTLPIPGEVSCTLPDAALIYCQEVAA